FARAAPSLGRRAGGRARIRNVSEARHLDVAADASREAVRTICAREIDRGLGHASIVDLPRETSAVASRREHEPEDDGLAHVRRLSLLDPIFTTESLISRAKSIGIGRAIAPQVVVATPGEVRLEDVDFIAFSDDSGSVRRMAVVRRSISRVFDRYRIGE